MKKSSGRLFFLNFLREFLWLTITVVAIYAILYPITSKIDFIYWQINAFFIFITLTYFRYSVTFRKLQFLRPAWVRFLLFAVNFSLFLYLMHYEQKFVALSDNYYTEDFGFPKIIMYEDIKRGLFKYLYDQIIFFGTGSLLMIITFQLRLIISYWQYYKHKAANMLES
jgi:hypothetical protein